MNIELVTAGFEEVHANHFDIGAHWCDLLPHEK